VNNCYIAKRVDFGTERARRKRPKGMKASAR
jgi:hypothetical protein